MRVYASGLSHEQLIEMVKAGSNISDGRVRKARNNWRGVLSYQVPDPTSESGKRQAEVSRILMVMNEDTGIEEKARCAGRGAVSKAQAVKLLAQWRADVLKDMNKASGAVVDPSQTVRECLAAFIDSKQITDEDGNEVGARRSTITFYRNIARRIEKYPTIASVPLGSLTQASVKQWVKELATTYSKKTISDTLNLLDATCREYLPAAENPCSRVSVPKNVRTGTRKSAAKRISDRPNALNESGIKRMNTLLDERSKKIVGTDYVALGARLALATGMRAEECCGLRWRDVDLRSKTIRVCNVIERYEEIETDKDGKEVRRHYLLADAAPKTEKSRRAIPITQTDCDMLAEHKSFVMGELAALFPNAKDRPSIFDLYVLGTLDGRPYSPHRLGANFAKFARTRNLVGTEGVTVNFHSMRHSFATQQHLHGTPWSTISSLLGHANVAVTMQKYVGDDPEAWRAAVDATEETFNARAKEGAAHLQAI